MDSTKKAVIIGALLHDIGKVGQRAQKKEELSKETLSREGEICPGANYPIHLHVLWTHEFFEKYFPDDLKNYLFRAVTEETNPLNLASFHHKPDSNLKELIQIADRTSSGEREETERGDKDEYITKRLASIFNKISLKNDKKTASEPYFHELRKLSLEREVFPNPQQSFAHSNVDAQRKLYRELWKGFIEDFKNLSKRTLSHNFGFDLFLSGIYHLLMKYTWCVPSYTNAKDEIDNDISLFDHSRVTAAIASCLYDLYGTNKVPSRTNHKEFIIAEGDISGIQKFLYRLSQPSGIKGVGRILRGRSMFLALLPIVTANYIVKEVDHSLVNILYAGGGNFQVLLPNIKSVSEKLASLRETLDGWLFDTFRGELGIVVAHTEASRDELGKNYGSVISKLKVNTENEKAKKFLKPLLRDNKFKIEQGDTQCKVCGSFDATPSANDEEMLCELCTEHRKLGEYLPKSKYLTLAPSELNLDHGTRICFGPAGYAWFSDKYIDERTLRDAYSHQIINSTDSVLGFRFLGKSVPKANEKIEPHEIEDREIEEGYYPGTTISFDHLDLLAEGDKKLGVLRMDVDHLGLIFSLGLRKYSDEGGKEEASGHSISRSATLSRMLDWFFTGYLNTLCDKLSKDLSSTAGGLASKVDGFYYIVYSGGDDLFVVAPWDKALELAFEIRKELKEFCANNDDIDISGGLSLVGRKLPISRSAELAKELEDKAKEKRGSLAAFGEAATWDVMNEGLEFGKALVKAINAVNREKLPRTFLNRVLEIRRMAGKSQDNSSKAYLYVPELVYSIVRNVNEKLKVSVSGQDLLMQDELMRRLVSKERGLEESGFPIKYALLKTRRR